MPPAIDPGEKFGCLAFRHFNLAHGLPGDVDLGYGKVLHQGWASPAWRASSVCGLVL